MGRALIVDPGKRTGYGFFEWGAELTGPNPPGVVCRFYGGECSHDEFLDWLVSAPGVPPRGSSLPIWGVTHVVCEGFNVTGRTPQTNPTHRELWSVGQLFALQMYARWAGIPFFDPFPAAKDYDKDGSKIKKLGWWKAAPGVKGEKGHRQDAARHAVKWGVDHRIIPLEALL